MVAVCKATWMAVTYFMKSTKENQNLPLTQNLINWLAQRYNMDVKVIRSDNQMNQIKRTEWCNQKVISFEPFAPDTHAQNGDAEHFGRLIMEKLRAMHLSANLPQLTCKTLQYGRKSNTLRQPDESNQRNRMVQPESYLFWAIRPRYPCPKRRRRAFRTIDYGKDSSNASVSQSTAQSLEKNCVHGANYTTESHERRTTGRPPMRRFTAMFLTKTQSPVHKNRFFTS